MRFLADYLSIHADDLGDRTALVLSDSSCERLSISAELTWRRLQSVVESLAGLLRQRVGTASSLRIAHTVQNVDEDLLFALACYQGRLTECPLDENLGDRLRSECREKLDAVYFSASEKSALVKKAALSRASVGTRASARSSSKDGEPDDDALILWTSGTTGGSKGVVLSHRSLLANAKAKLIAAPQGVCDVRLTLLSIAHAYARTCDIGTWLVSGCTLAIARGFDGWCERSGDLVPTLCNVVPSLAERMVSSEDAARLRFLGCGGAAMSLSAYEEWRGRGVPVVQGYGATETGPVISSQGPDDSVACKVGKVVEGWQCKIDEGRLFVRGPSLMTRYWKDPVATRNKICLDGWFDTADIVTECPETSQLIIHGRADDRIVLSTGYKVDPYQLESRYRTIQGVTLARVESTDDQRGLELWYEGQADHDQLTAVGKGASQWERPRVFRRFQIPEAERSTLLTRKGELRRDVPLEQFACVPGN